MSAFILNEWKMAFFKLIKISQETFSFYRISKIKKWPCHNCMTYFTYVSLLQTEVSLSSVYFQWKGNPNTSAWIETRSADVREIIPAIINNKVNLSSNAILYMTPQQYCFRNKIHSWQWIRIRYEVFIAICEILVSKYHCFFAQIGPSSVRTLSNKKYPYHHGNC